MTAEDSVPPAVADADQERWLTYLNYDQSVKQAVRRLGALSVENVDLFRGLLMQGRDRTRVAEYEAESIRRLQGEVFVGDEELQRALIVLNAEDPHLAEEFKRMVAATGKPQELDQAIAALRAKDAPVPPPKIKLVETPPAEAPIAKAAQPPQKPEPAAQAKTPPSLSRAPEEAERVEPPRQEVPRVKPRLVAVQSAKEPEEGRSWRMPAIATAVVLIAVAGLAVIWPRLANRDGAPAAQIATAPQAAAPQPQSTQTQAAAPVSRNAPAAEIPMPPQSAGKMADAKTPPEIRPASDGADKLSPDKAAPQASPATTSAPVPGAYYKVVRGDMLTDIAVRAYRDASKFLVIQRANPSLRASADRILVDQVIFIPPAS